MEIYVCTRFDVRIEEISFKQCRKGHDDTSVLSIVYFVFNLIPNDIVELFR